MARMRSMSFFNLISILFLIYILLSSQHFKRAKSEPFEDEEEEDDDNEGYVVDSHFSTNGIRASRFLASSVLVRSGQQCTNRTTNVNTNRKKKVICNGVHVGTMLLYCCKKHCRDISRDRSNCGGCGNRCKVHQRCCGGVCTDILSNRGHCGKCDKKCPNGIPCEGGICGYA